MIFQRITVDNASKRLALIMLLCLLCASGVQGARASTQATIIVTFANFSYSPALVYINAGDIVNWQGNFVAHPLVSEDGLWATRSTGASFNFTFSNPGSFRYYCNQHGGPGGMGMSGQVIVTGPFTAFMPLVVK